VVEINLDHHIISACIQRRTEFSVGTLRIDQSYYYPATSNLMDGSVWAVRKPPILTTTHLSCYRPLHQPHPHILLRNPQSTGCLEADAFRQKQWGPPKFRLTVLVPADTAEHHQKRLNLNRRPADCSCRRNQ